MALRCETFDFVRPQALICWRILCLINYNIHTLCCWLPHLQCEGSREAPGQEISRGVGWSTEEFPKVDCAALNKAGSVAGRIPWTVVQKVG